MRANDRWSVTRAGFRIDKSANPDDALTISGDFYGGIIHQTMIESASFTPPYNRVFDFDTDVYGGHALGRWSRQFSNTARMRLGVYYDISRRKDVAFDDLRHTIDFDFQHQFSLWKRHDIVWGFGYRWARDRLRNSMLISWRQERRTIRIFSAFLQDELELLHNRVRITFGTKLEHHDFTGCEIQPSVRLLWTPSRQQAIWGAVSRAVRLPTRGETDGRYLEIVEPLGPTVNSPLAVVEVLGSEDFGPENVISYELGYRIRPSNRFSLDIAGYYSVYDNLLSGEPQDPIVNSTTVPPRVEVLLLADNKANAETAGVEIAADWYPTPQWQWRAAYTYLHLDLTNDPDGKAQFTEDAEGEIPNHQFVLRAMLDMANQTQLDVTLRYVDELPFDVVDANAAPVLTVSEQTDFCAQDGMINFVLRQNRARFEMNPDAAERAGLEISSRLLKLAEIVKDTSREEP